MSCGLWVVSGCRRQYFDGDVSVNRTSFEKLRVYELAEILADTIGNVTLQWDHYARDTVGKQIVRAADSVGANIAEGLGRGTSADNQRFVRIARGSLNETKHWLRRAYKRHLLPEKTTAELRPLVDELAPKLNAYLRSISERAKAHRKGNSPPTTHDSQPTTDE